MPEGHVALLPQPIHVELDNPPPRYRPSGQKYVEDYSHSSPSAFRRHYFNAQRDGLQQAMDDKKSMLGNQNWEEKRQQKLQKYGMRHKPRFIE